VVAVLILILGVLSAVVFLPPLQARFVSDTFGLYESAKQQSFFDVLSQFVPQPGHWYRPTTEVVFWIEARLFATAPFGYHLVALGCHLLSSLLIWMLVRRLSGVGVAAVVAAATFLFLPLAHETLWDIADLHTALAGPAMLAAVLAYLTGRRWLALCLSIAALTVDESGLLAIAFIAFYELTIVSRPFRRSLLTEVALRQAPFVLAGLAYVGTRVLAGSIYNEVGDPCRSLRCLGQAAMHYFNRFYVRPDAFLQDIWVHQVVFVAWGGVLGLMLVAALRPWSWISLRPSAFAFGWLVGGSLFFALTLWPYIPDRFLYIPAMGMAMLVGTSLAELPTGWRVGTGVRKAGLVAAGAVFIAWFVLGVPMLVERGAMWLEAGDQAASIVGSVRNMVPDPPADTVFFFTDIPDSTTPAIPPGNSGPYLFHNGLTAALQLAYGRSDLSAQEAPLTGGDRSDVFTITGRGVTRAP
jgi:hypothetical protein